MYNKNFAYVKHVKKIQISTLNLLVFIPLKIEEIVSILGWITTD